MSVFNTSPQYIKDAVVSILETQTYKGQISLVIIDDGSTDPRTIQHLQ